MNAEKTEKQDKPEPQIAPRGAGTQITADEYARILAEAGITRQGELPPRPGLSSRPAGRDPRRLGELVRRGGLIADS